MCIQNKKEKQNKIKKKLENFLIMEYIFIDILLLVLLA